MTVVEIISCVAGIVRILNFASSLISRLRRIYRIRRTYHIRRKITDDGQPQPRYFVLIVEDDQNINLLTL